MIKSEISVVHMMSGADISQIGHFELRPMMEKLIERCPHMVGGGAATEIVHGKAFFEHTYEGNLGMGKVGKIRLVGVDSHLFDHSMLSGT